MRVTEKQLFISIKNQYRAAHKNVAASAQKMLAWAEEQGIYAPDARKARVRDAAKLSDALRTEYTTLGGQRVRLNHSYTSGQTELWDSLATISADNILLAFQNRRRGVSGEVKQIRRDEIGWNIVHADATPLQLGPGFFNFANDLADAGLVSPPSSSELEQPTVPLQPGLADSEEQREPPHPSSPRVHPRRRHEGSFLADAPPQPRRP